MAYTPRRFTKYVWDDDAGDFVLRAAIADSIFEDVQLTYEGWTPDDGEPYKPPVFSARQREELSATFAAGRKGPRDLPRVKHGLAPKLMVDNVWPRTALGEWNHVILSTEGTTWWAFGHDGTLRKSTSEGRTWFRTYRSDATGSMGRDGMWIKTTSGALLTTWHPFDGSPPSILRSTDNGVTWATVVPAAAGVYYLGPTSLVQSPTTGNLYLGEYITTAPAANPTCQIKVSADNGATWTVWKTLSRAYDTDPEVGVMHVHGIQVDPIDDRMWVCVGDAALSGGLYRMNAGETDWTPVAQNRNLDTEAGIWGGAVGLMFFPNYIAWGVDQSFTSGIVRMARTEIGQAVPAVELVMDTNSTCFYTCRTDTTNEEWVVCASQEGGDAAIDNAVHFYRVADDGATVDEIGSIPVNTATSFSWAFPLGTPLQTRPDRLMWWGANIHDGAGNTADLSMIGMQFAARVGWANDVIPRQNLARRYDQPKTMSSGRQNGLAPGATVNFAADVVPVRMRSLHIIDLGVRAWPLPVGVSSPAIEITDSAGNIIATDVATPISFATTGWRSQTQEDSAPYLVRTGSLPAGTEVWFRIKNNSGSTALDVSGFVTYAWGY